MGVTDKKDSFSLIKGHRPHNLLAHMANLLVLLNSVSEKRSNFENHFLVDSDGNKIRIVLAQILSLEAAFSFGERLDLFGDLMEGLNVWGGTPATEVLTGEDGSNLVTEDVLMLIGKNWADVPQLSAKMQLRADHSFLAKVSKLAEKKVKELKVKTSPEIGSLMSAKKSELGVYL